MIGRFKNALVKHVNRNGKTYDMPQCGLSLKLRCDAYFVPFQQWKYQLKFKKKQKTKTKINNKIRGSKNINLINLRYSNKLLIFFLSTTKHGNNI